ncbi:MAG: glycoside hydrolase family 9 protein, partial [Wujia sp.]
MRVTNKRCSSVLSWLLACVMAVCLAIVPGGSVKAADDAFATSRTQSGNVAVTISAQDAPSNDWSGFDVAISNNTGQSISDWIIKLSVPAGTAQKFKCWNATFVADGDTVYLYPEKSGSNAVLTTGAMINQIPGFGFESTYVEASSITVNTVYYEYGTTAKYDYSSGETNDENEGGGGSSTGSKEDTSTNKDLDVEFNYAKALQASLYFYDANMCGNLEGKCAVNWRGNCHTYDANNSVTIDGVTYPVDASGGFHDAGDHVKFGQPQGYAASALGMSYYEFKEAYTKIGQAAHLQKITDYFCDYFRRCTIYNTEGKVVGFVYQVGDGNADHASWSAPEGQTMNRPVFCATSSNPATDEVSVAIAALAINYMNFGNEADLKVAKDLFTFVNSNSKAVATEGASGFYSRYNGYEADLALASAALYKATNAALYQDSYNMYKDNINKYWMMDWDNTGAMASMLMEDTSVLSSIGSLYQGKTTLDGVYACFSDWGSCRYNTATQFVGLVCDKISGKKDFDAWAVSQMNYILGDNPNKRCYIVGYNENSSKYPHHRAASASSKAEEYSANHYTLLGALVGGPKNDGTYEDKQEEFKLNEVALDYNAGLVGALAGLCYYHYGETSTKLSYGNTITSNVSSTLLSSAELEALKMDPSQAGGSTEPSPVPSEQPSTAPST